jgi:hypothetical protein
MMADTVSLKLELHDAFSPARGQRATAAPPQHDAQCCGATCEKVVLAEVEQQQKILVLLFRVPRCIRCAIFHVAAPRMHMHGHMRTHAHSHTLPVFTWHAAAAKPVVAAVKCKTHRVGSCARASTAHLASHSKRRRRRRRPPWGGGGCSSRSRSCPSHKLWSHSAALQSAELGQRSRCAAAPQRVTGLAAASSPAMPMQQQPPATTQTIEPPAALCGSM